MNITLFGGGFDPPHLGHQHIARALLKQELADEVWYVPVKHHPFGKVVSSDEHRVAMLELMLETGTRIDHYELERTEMSFSYQTLTALSDIYSEHTFSWILGSDNLPKFHLWQNYAELLQQFTVYVYPRQGFPFEPLYPGMKSLENVEEVVVASSDIRTRVKAGQSISDLVTPAVADYIQEHELYL